MCQFQRNIKRKINVSDEYMVNVQKNEKNCLLGKVA